MCVVPPPVDAGTPDVGVITQDAGTDLGMDVGADLGPAPTYGFQGNGCGCRVGDGTSRPSGALVALGVAGLLLASRRRRRRGLSVAGSVGR
jgi:MYXO-CTERM domain-containing protein